MIFVLRIYPVNMSTFTHHHPHEHDDKMNIHPEECNTFTHHQPPGQDDKATPHNVWSGGFFASEQKSAPNMVA
jgi:hypothetical protein